jgi:nucleotide-binding universal stress UspA family protein
MSQPDSHAHHVVDSATRDSRAAQPAPDTRFTGAFKHAAVTSWPHHILVSTNGSTSSDSAVACARELARRSGASIETLAVYSPRIPVPLPVQSPLARNLGADLVVIGIGAREPDDRPSYAGRRSARLPEYLGVPVLAVAAGCEVLTCAVVAFPDGRIRHRVICSALACMPSGSQLSIVLPKRPIDDGAESETFDLGGIGMRSPRAAEALQAIQIRRVDMTGGRCAAILDLAETLGVELIAVSEPRANDVDRGEDLAEWLLLSARCSVLVVPDRHDD